jgi:hypothetical protein
MNTFYEHHKSSIKFAYRSFVGFVRLEPSSTD